MELLIPVLVFTLVITVTFAAILSRYKRCPSDKILVIYGKTGRNKEGGVSSARCIHGGAAFIWPVFQSYAFLDLKPISIETLLTNALSKQNIRVDVPSRFTVAISTEAEVVMYRKDLLQAAGLGPIRTFDDLEAAAKAMNKDGVAGIVGRGRRGLDVVWVWTGFFLGLGGEFLKDGKAAVDSDAGVAATELYINKLLKENGPQGTANMSWLEASGVFKEGKAAMYPDASGLVAVVIDKKTNKNADQVGVFAWPSGKGAQPAPDYWFWLFGIPASSKNKEAAALFTAWATSPEVELDVGRGTGSPVARASVWADADFKKFYPGEMADEIAKNLTNVQAARVPYGDPRFPNAADALSVELVNVLTGSKDAAAAMKAAQAAMDEAMQ